VISQRYEDVMNIVALGSTVKSNFLKLLRVIRVDDDGRVEVVAPSGSPIEVSDVGVTAVEEIIWGASAAETVPNGTYTGGETDALDCSDAHEVHFEILIDTGTPAYLDVEPQWSNDGGSTWRYLPLVASVSDDGEVTTTLESHIVERNGVATLTNGASYPLIYKRPKSATTMRLRIKAPSAGNKVVVSGFAEV